jgi:hypothetical protein
MVRINLFAINNSSTEQKLDFSQVGNLIRPINAKTVSVARFSIPNAWTELMEFHDNTYVVSMTYHGWSYSQTIQNIDLGSGNLIYIISDLLLILNAGFVQCLAGLASIYFINTGLVLPITIAPRLIYDSINSLFSLIINPTEYGSGVNQIAVFFNTALFMIIESISSVIEHSNGPDNFRFEINITQTPENTYLTNYVKLTQEQISTANFASPRLLYITTTMPIEGEIQVGLPVNIGSPSSNLTIGSSQQSSFTTLQSYIFPYDAGTKDILTNSDFTTVSEPFHECKILAKDLYNISCDCYYQTRDGTIKNFYLPPLSSANIELEFKD